MVFFTFSLLRRMIRINRYHRITMNQNIQRRSQHDLSPDQRLHNRNGGMRMENKLYTLAQMQNRLSKFPSFQHMSPSTILEGVDFFSDVDSAVIEQLADEAVIFEYSAGSLICRHGKFNEWLYVILKGEVRAIIPTTDNPRYE